MRLFPIIIATAILLTNQAFPQTPLLSPALPGSRRSATPSPSATLSKEAAAERKAQYEQAVSALKDRIGDASDSVMSKIITQEKDLRMRLGYFERTERLNPNSFASKEEIQSWQKLADQLQQSRDLTAKLYGDASENLEAALINQKIAPVLASAIRKEIINTFPWDDISKKDDLVTTFVGFHRQLLNFFDQNWKTWNSQKPYFSDQKIETDYEKLCQQITSTGKEIETIYARNNF